MGYKLSVGGKKFDVEIGPIVDGHARVSVNTRFYDVAVENFGEVPAGIPPAAAAEAPAIPAKPARSAVSLLNPAQDVGLRHLSHRRPTDDLRRTARDASGRAGVGRRSRRLSRGKYGNSARLVTARIIAARSCPDR